MAPVHSSQVPPVLTPRYRQKRGITVNLSRQLIRWASAAGLAIAVLIVPALPVAQTNVSVVMSGLDSPRGLAFGPEGALYVTEAGRGAGVVTTSRHGSALLYRPPGRRAVLWGHRCHQPLVAWRAGTGRDGPAIDGTGRRHPRDGTHGYRTRTWARIRHDRVRERPNAPR